MNTDHQALVDSLFHDLDSLQLALDLTAAVTPEQIAKVGDWLDKAKKSETVIGTIHNQTICRLFTAVRILATKAALVEVESDNPLSPPEIAAAKHQEMHQMKRLMELMKDLCFLQLSHEMGTGANLCDVNLGFRHGWVLVTFKENGPQEILGRLFGGNRE